MFVFPVERIEHFNSRYESRSVTSRIFSAVEKLRKLQDGKHGAAVEDHRDLLQGTTWPGRALNNSLLLSLYRKHFLIAT